MPRDLNIREALSYLWDMKARNIDRMEQEARPRYAKIFDKIIGKRKKVKHYGDLAKR